MTRGLSGKEKLAYRSEHSEAVVQAFWGWCDKQCHRPSRLLPSSLLAKAWNYALARKASLEVFLADPDVAIDTNHLERSLRPIPMGKKNWLFAWTEIGAERIGIIQSLLVTCRLQGVDPYVYLVDVLQRVSAHPASRVIEPHPTRVENAVLPQPHEIRPGAGPAITGWNGRLRSNDLSALLPHKQEKAEVP